MPGTRSPLFPAAEVRARPSYEGQAASISFEGRPSVDESRLSRIRLGEDPLILVMAGGHRLAGRDTVRRTELRSEAFIPVSPLMPTFPAVERHLGFRPQFAAVETADHQAILGLVAAGLGVALVPKTVVEQARRTDMVARPSPAGRSADAWKSRSPRVGTYRA